MGGRGTFAAGKNVAPSYKIVGNIAGVNVLEGIAEKHSLPEESHTSPAYIKLKPDGRFHEMRIYGENHEILLEIAYHRELKLKRNGEDVLHIHTYGPGFNRHKASPITKEIYDRYSKFFVGVPRHDQW